MSVKRTLVKVTLWLVGSILGLVILAYLALLAINWRDQPPSESAIKLQGLRDSRPLLANEDNGYVYAMGFSVARDADPRAAGLEQIEEHRRLTEDEATAAAQAAAEPGYRKQRSPAVQAMFQACQSVTAECLSKLEGEPQPIADWLASEQWLLERYKTLLAHEGWVETGVLRPEINVPNYATLLDGQRLLLLSTWQLAGRQDAGAIQEALARDVRFWRRVLEDSDNLITKMIATAALNRHFEWSNVVLRRLPAAIVRQGMPESWADEISKAERSMLRCLAGEWVFMQRGVLQQMGDDFAQSNLLTRLLLLPMFQSQDTANKKADVMLAVAKALDVSYVEFPTALGQAQLIENQTLAFLDPLPDLYNPIGTLLLAIGTYELSAYAVRVADIEGSRRAAVLAVELRSREVSSEGMSVALAESSLRTPYSDQPFEWDPLEGAIVFTGLQASERGRHVFKY